VANTDASLEFDLPPAAGVLFEQNIQQQLQQFGHRVAGVSATQARMEAAILNNRILSRNRHYMSEVQRQRPLRKYVRFSFLLLPSRQNSSCDFPRPQGTAMTWHAQYMAPSPPVFKITNLTLLLVTYRSCGIQTLTHTKMQTYSGSLYFTTTILGSAEMILSPLGKRKYVSGWSKSDGGQTSFSRCTWGGDGVLYSILMHM
jgi:hypothetical protein